MGLGGEVGLGGGVTIVHLAIVDLWKKNTFLICKQILLSTRAEINPHWRLNT